MQGLLLALCLLASDRPQEPYQDLILHRDGEVELVQVLAAEERRLRYRRFGEENDRLLDWRKLFPGEADRVRQGRDSAFAMDILEVQADRLRMKRNREVIGRILGLQGDNYEVHVRGKIQLQPKSLLIGEPDQVLRPAPLVLSPERFVQEHPAPGGGAEALWNYGRACTGAMAWEPAENAFRKAASAAEAEGKAELQRQANSAAERMAALRAHHGQASALKRIQTQMKRNEFEQAEKALPAAEALLADSPLADDFFELQSTFEEERQLAILSYLEKNWYEAVLKVLQAPSRNRKANMDRLMLWLREQAPGEVRVHLMRKLKDMDDQLTAEGLTEIWERRMERKKKKARIRSASYGTGTWIVSPNLALPRTYYRDHLETAEEWWETAPASTRSNFLMAYYAEHSGDFAVLSHHTSTCQTCGGTGVTTAVNIRQNSRVKKAVCPTCHYVGKEQSVRFQ
ncbi:MAG: hypothetical protein DWQ01_22700 [Planctomycetota bacterium]|nr:MAG: hypothetical protein DWQ01_22700 [Planctomycetota bacterium]